MRPRRLRSISGSATFRMVAIGILVVVSVAQGGCTGPPARRPPATDDGPRGPRTTPPIAVAADPCRGTTARLSFISARDGEEEIYTLDVHRPQEAVQITRLPGAVEDPAWSPDGRRVAFRWFLADSVGLYLGIIYLTQ